MIFWNGWRDELVGVRSSTSVRQSDEKDHHNDEKDHHGDEKGHAVSFASSTISTIHVMQMLNNWSRMQSDSPWTESMFNQLALRRLS